MSRKRLLLIIIVLVIVPVVYYLASPLFINVQVSEVIPREGSILATGSFVNADDFHTAEGTAKIIHSDGGRVLRFENFNVRNGPDLYVYLGASRDVKDFVDLGRLKGNIGDQNYQVSSQTDLARYKVVVIWCKAFTTPFGYAELKIQ